MSIDARGPFQIVTEEAHEDSAELLFLPEATATDWATIFSFAEVREVVGRARARAGRRGRPRAVPADRGHARACGCRARRRRSSRSTRRRCVGELAFFDGSPRSATLDALTDVQVVRIDIDCFSQLSEAEPALAHAMLLDLARILALRLRMASDVIASLRG